MTQDEFWQHIDAARRADPDEHADRLAARLAKLPLDEILSFGRWWHRAVAATHTWEMWGAAYLVNGGCSDDGFEYFLHWLVLQGRAVFDAAVKDPDTLADHLRGETEVECGEEPALDAYCAVTGQEDYYEALEGKYPDLEPMPDSEAAWEFEDDDEMRRRYPKLFAMYCEDPG